MFSRPLLSFGVDADPTATIALARALCPQARTLRVLLSVPSTGRVSVSDADLRQLEDELEAADASLYALGRAASVGGLELEGTVAVDPLPEALAAEMKRHRSDLVIFGAFTGVAPETVASWAIEATRAHAVVAASGPLHDDRFSNMLCPFDGSADSLTAAAAFLRDRCSELHEATLLSLGALDPRLLADHLALLAVAGIRARVCIESIDGGWLTVARGLDVVADQYGAHAIVLSSEVGSGTVVDVLARVALRTLSRGKRPLVFLPRVVPTELVRQGTLDAPDALAIPHVDVVLRLERIGGLGHPSPIEDEPVAIVIGGQHVATLFAREGRLLVSHTMLPEAMTVLGLGRGDDGGDPLGTLETAVAIESIGTSRITLVDSRLDEAALVKLQTAVGDESRTLYAVRLAPDEAARDVRARWTNAGLLRPRVLDARDLLHEGDADDVPGDVAAVRLARAAARLRARGALVDSIVAPSPGRARGAGFSVVDAASCHELRTRVQTEYAPPDAHGSLAARLDTTTASRVVPGNRVHVDLDNGDALVALVALIDGARARLHAQWYIVEDDEITRTVEQALVRAGARGVDVRILVDSLYSLHGSFGAENSLLTRLARAPGVTLHVSRPIDHVPSIADLKQRDHRKVAVADGARAIVSGRNLGQTYYRAFGAAKLGTASSFADVPWLDASASIEGPAVAVIEAAFLEAWCEAGGAPFEVLPVPPVGDAGLRIVVHRGLQDAYTLETYLALIDGARARLSIVNSFPLQLEMQHTLLRAIDRGVKVSLYLGRMRPEWGEGIPFPGGAYRAIADALVRARLDALVDAGAEVRELAMRGIDGWDPALGLVRPPVHAKIVCADSRHLALGSANLDITAGYWESEAVVVVDDVTLSRSVEQRLEAYFAATKPIERQDPSWRQGAGLRAWLGRAWPNVLG